MLVVGLTGGVGSGKSTVTGYFGSYGALIIDADVIAREVVAPETDGLEAVVRRFGRDVVVDSGRLDRAKLASIVFSDPVALQDLEEIVHPRVRHEVRHRLDDLRDGEARNSHSVVLVVVPLFVESGHYPVDRLVVVDCEESVVVKRLMENRGWTELQAHQRMSAQVSRADRVSAADYVIDNSGDIEELEDRVGRCWEWLMTG